MGPNRDVAEHVVEDELASHIRPAFRKVPIAVHNLSRAIVARPTVYVLSYVHARIPAFGASLRSVSFYGDDLGEADLFAGNIDYMDVFTCGLRRAVGGPELLRVSGDGMVSFRYANPTSVLQIEEALSFLKQQGYLLTEFLDH